MCASGKLLRSTAACEHVSLTECVNVVNVNVEFERHSVIRAERRIHFNIVFCCAVCEMAFYVYIMLLLRLAVLSNIL